MLITCRRKDRDLINAKRKTAAEDPDNNKKEVRVIIMIRDVIAMRAEMLETAAEEEGVGMWKRTVVEGMEDVMEIGMADETGRGKVHGTAEEKPEEVQLGMDEEEDGTEEVGVVEVEDEKLIEILQVGMAEGMEVAMVTEVVEKVVDQVVATMTEVLEEMAVREMDPAIVVRGTGE